MSREGLKYWYLADHGDGRSVFNVFPGRCESEVREDFAGAIGKARLIRLTWLRLSELTACIIPSIVKGDDYATGGLMFNHLGTFTTLWMSK